jgi:hypothetical protein
VISKTALSTVKVDQRGANAGGDLVAGSKNVQVLPRQTQLEGWIRRLESEQPDLGRIRDFVDNLQIYFNPRPYDEVVGLEAKLQHAGRESQCLRALQMKEAFSKLLERWQAYSAAQEIFAYFLAKIDACFETDIVPILATESSAAIDQMIKSKLVDPILEEMSLAPFMLNANHVFGMVYWLAEQCYVRWHI